jgi:hypothetical protein
LQTLSSPLPPPLVPGAWAALFLGIALWAIFEFAHARIPPMSSLHVLRTIANFSASIGFIPIFEVLLSTVSCGGDFEAPDGLWSRLGIECFAGSHLTIVVVAIALAVGFAAFVAVFAFVFVDSNPLSPGLEGQSSGRYAVLMLLWKVRSSPAWGPHAAVEGEVKSGLGYCNSAPQVSQHSSSPPPPPPPPPPPAQIILIILVSTIPEHIGASALSGVLVVAGFVWLTLLLRFMPYTNHSMGRVQLAMANIFLSSTVALVFAQGYTGFDAAVSRFRAEVCPAMRLNTSLARALLPQILLYLLFVPSIFIGVFLADVRRNYVLRANPNDLGSPLEVRG